MKDDRCERCERLIADLRAEFEQLREPREELMREVREIAEAIVEDVAVKSSALLTKIEQRTRGLLADVDRNVKRLFDALSERLLLPPRRTDKEPPRRH